MPVYNADTESILMDDIATLRDRILNLTIENRKLKWQLAMLQKNRPLLDAIVGEVTAATSVTVDTG